jgi:hypothetical protein
VSNAVAGVAELVYNFTLFDTSYSWSLPGLEPDNKLTAEQAAERRRQESDRDNYYELCRKLGLPPPCPPWGVPRSKSPRQERAEAEANAQWRWMMRYGF